MNYRHQLFSTIEWLWDKAPNSCNLVEKVLCYYTQLTRFVVRGLWVLLAMLTAIRKLLIQLIWYYYNSTSNLQISSEKGMDHPWQKNQI